MVLKRTMYLGNLKVFGVFRITTIPLYHNLRGSHSVLLTHLHGGTLVPNKAIHLVGRWELNRPRKRVPFTLFTRSNMVRVREGQFCRILAVTCGFEEDVSSTWDGFTAWVESDPDTTLKRHLKKVFILLTAMHQPESIFPPLVATSTITCQIVQLNKRC